MNEDLAARIFLSHLENEVIATVMAGYSEKPPINDVIEEINSMSNFQLIETIRFAWERKIR